VKFAKHRILFFILVLIVAAGCSGKEKPYKPIKLPWVKNVVLVSIDSLRADHLGVYGYKRSTSPNIDRFAKQAIRFGRAYSSSNWTLPGHAGMFTGLMSSGHSGFNHEKAVRPDAPFIVENLANAGFKTASFVSHIFVSEKYGFNRGYSTFDYEQLCPAPKLTGKTIQWLEQLKPDQRFFLFLHYFDVHMPYGREGAPIKQFAQPGCTGPYPQPMVLSSALRQDWEIFKCYRDLYDADIAFTDQELNRIFKLFDKTNRWKDTLFILTSDHGELFGEHSGAAHSNSLFEEEIHVPLLMRYPGGAGGGTVVSEPISTIQLASTILEATGLKPFKTDMPGLTAFLQGQAPAPAFVAAESRIIGSDLIAVIQDQYKAVLPPRHVIQGVPLAPALYDYRRIGENQNLWFARPKKSLELYQLAAKSGWYGRGVSYEIIYSPAEDSSASIPVEMTLQSERQPVYIKAISKKYVFKDTKIVVVKDSAIRLDNNKYTFEIPARKDAGLVFMIDPPETKVTIYFPQLSLTSGVKLFVGEIGKASTDNPVILSGPISDFTKETDQSKGPYLLIRSYDALHLDRPTVAPQKNIELTPEQRQILRTLGYI